MLKTSKVHSPTRGSCGVQSLKTLFVLILLLLALAHKGFEKVLILLVQSFQTLYRYAQNNCTCTYKSKICIDARKCKCIDTNLRFVSASIQIFDL